jgi:hypothetical protein
MGSRIDRHGKQKREEQAAEETVCTGDINTDTGSRRDRQEPEETCTGRKRDRHGKRTHREGS